jgi:putative tricarboxylic transport membrane protein
VKRDEIIGGAIVCLFGGVTTALSFTMPIGTFRMAGSGLFPLCLGILLMILAGSFIFSLIYKKETSLKKEAVTQPPASVRQMIFFLAVMILTTLFFNVLGYPLSSFLLLLFLLRALGIKRWVFTVVLSLATAIGSYILFVRWLNIPLPKGWIGL